MESQLFFFAMFVLCGSVHEYAHAWMAHRLGDDTAARLGRMTLNPLVHLDPIGTVLLPLFQMFTGAPIPLFWMKPVPFNALRFRRWRKDVMLVALAGPVANLLLALLFVGVFYALRYGPGTDELLFRNSGSTVDNLFRLVRFNIFMAIFNMFPIHPLDGSKVLGGLLPVHLAQEYDNYAPYGIFILVACIFLKVFQFVIATIVDPLTAFLMFGIWTP